MCCIENFAPDVMGRLKLDYDSVKKIKADIIYCSISCFGHWGPYSHRPGYDMIAQGASGWSDQSNPPIIAPVSIGDTVAGDARHHGHPTPRSTTEVTGRARTSTSP